MEDRKKWMTLKPKSWIWRLTLFAGNNYTTIGSTLYYPPKYPPSKDIIDHEEVHMRQQQEVGLLKFIFLYLFMFPIIYNPWRWKWEYEAYVSGERWTDSQAKQILRSSEYGWLRWMG